MSEEEFDEDHAMDMVLNDMVMQLQKVRVRFPNETNYIILNGFQKENFEKLEEYENDVYGKYKGQYLMLNKKDYETLL